MNSKMSNEESSRRELTEAFAQCGDEQGSGYVAINKLKEVMRAVGFEPRQAEVKKLTAKLMENKTARSEHPDEMNVDELVLLLKERLEQRGGEAEMRSAFGMFDVDGKGFISLEDLKSVAQQLGELIPEEQLKEMITEADTNNVGYVTERDFFAVMKKTLLY